MVKRVFILFLVSLINFSSAFALQPGQKLLIAADKVIDSGWDEEGDWGDDNEDWADDESWEDEELIPVKPVQTPEATTNQQVAPSPIENLTNSNSISPTDTGNSTTVSDKASSVSKEPAAVTVSGPGFRASSTPAPKSALIQAAPPQEPSAVVAPAPINQAEVTESLKNIELTEITEAKEEANDPESGAIVTKAKHSPEELRNLFKVYGNVLQGLDPKNPHDLNEIEKLIEIVGIPTPEKGRKKTTPPPPKPGELEPIPTDPYVNFSARNIPIRDAFATLARVSGKSITVSGLIADRDAISVIEVNNQPFTKAFLSLVEAAEVDFAVHGDNYTILKRRGGQTNKTTASFGTAEVDTSLPVDERVSDLSYDDEALGAVIKDIAEKYGVDIVLTSVPTDKVTLRIRGVTAEEALQMAFAGSQFQYTRKDDAFIVYSKANKNFSLGRKSVFFPLKYLEAKEIGALLPTDLKASVKVSENQNAVIVEGTKDELTQMFEFLRTVDKPIPQVELDVKLVEVSKNFDRAHNIYQDTLQIGRMGTYTAPGAAPATDAAKKVLGGTARALARILTAAANGDTGTDTDAGSSTKTSTTHEASGGFNMNFREKNFDVLRPRATYSEQNGVAQIKVSQRLLVTSGKSAKINFDKEVNVVLNSADAGGTGTVGVVQSARIQRITAGNSMNITPTVGAGGMVAVKIEVEVSANGEQDSRTGVPKDTTRRRISSEVQIANHETISIGGIFDDQKKSGTGNELPFLGKLPIIGNLFKNGTKSKSQRELLVLLTPHLKTNTDSGTETEYAYLSGN